MRLLNLIAFLSVQSSVNSFSGVPSFQRLNRLTAQTFETTTSPTTTTLYSEEGAENNEGAPEEATEDEAPAADAGNDILNSPAFLKRKLEVLTADVAELEDRVSGMNAIYEENKVEWGPQMDKLRTEYVNIQDRMKAKMKAGGGQANIEIAKAILNVLDNYDRAFKAVAAETDAEKEVEAAYKETYDMIMKEFADIGVKQVETVGVEFDYEIHQAVMQRPFEGFEEGFVAEELAKGYAMEDGTLIRAAMVVVAA